MSGRSGGRGIVGGVSIYIRPGERLLTAEGTGAKQGISSALLEKLSQGSCVEV